MFFHSSVRTVCNGKYLHSVFVPAVVQKDQSDRVQVGATEHGPQVAEWDIKVLLQ